MRKWKVFLVMLCAMLVSIGLFACKNDGGSAEDLQNITRVTGASDLKYTDEDQWSNIVSSLQSSVKLTCRPVEGDNVTINGDACNFTSTIQFDSNNHCVVGNYTITITPKENNPKNLSRTVDVEIAHAFGTPENNVSICSYCHATNTSITEDTIVHYGAFHQALTEALPAGVYEETSPYTNKNTTNSQIKEFGTVTVATNGVEEDRMIPTLTVGQLEPGMSITVKGTAQTSWSKRLPKDTATDAGYYFPVIGFADRYMNNPTFEGKTTSGYTGGTSVFVRGEGWVLYNGIGNDAGKYRPLGALSAYATGDIGDGSGTARNYGSHENAEAGADEIPPASFRPGQIPAVENWTPWIVYSTGTTHNSGDYVDVTNIELTWNYRQDGIVELIYTVNGTKLVCMVKVAEPTRGYFDTMLHGDYVDMHITSYERIETRTPTNFEIEVAKDNYYEGQEFNPETVSATFTYLQSGNTKYPQTLTLDNIFATEAASLEGDVEWVPMTANKVDGKYNFYKVEVAKGGQVWSKTFAKNAINVVENNIESAAGADATGFANNNTVGELAFGTDGTNVILTPVGTAYVQSVPTGSAFANNVPADHTGYRYVAIKLGGALGAITAVTSNDATPMLMPYTYANGVLVLGLTSEIKAVTVTGLNAVPTVFDFSAALGFNTRETIAIKTDAEGWYLNNTANEVTVSFTANEGMNIGRIYVGEDMYMNPSNLVESATGNSNLSGASYDAGTRTLTFTAAFPAADLANYAPRSIRVQVGAAYDFEYKIDYVAGLVKTANTMDGNYYSFVSGNKIYLAALASDLQETNDLALNLNAGNDNVSILDLSFTYKEGVAALASRTLTGAEIDVLDFANGKVVLIEIDPTAYGITATGAYGYQLKRGDAYSQYYFAVASGAATRTALESEGEPVILNEGSCLEKGLRGEIVGTTNKFVANAVEFAGSHHFGSLAANATCEYCGEKLARTQIAQIGTITLYDNQFVEISEAYREGSVTLKDNNNYALWSGLYLRLTVGNTSYRIRNDGYIANWATNAAATETNIVSSLGAERTPVGKYDGDNQFISEEGFMNTMNAGAKFRIWAGYQDGTFTVIWRLYKAGDVDTLMNDYGKVYFEFTQTFKDLNRESVSLVFGLDGASISHKDSSNATWWTRGEIDKTMIKRVVELNKEDGQPVATPTNKTVTYSVGTIENHYATVSALGGNAVALDAEAKEDLGIKDDATYTKCVMFGIEFNEDYASDVLLASVVDENGNAIKGAMAVFNPENAAMLMVVVALGETHLPGVYYLDLINGDGSSKQVDIKVDLTAVSVYDTTGTVSGVDSFVKNNTVTITYADLPAGDLKVSLNGADAVALGASMNLGGNVTGAWNAGASTLTLTIPAQLDLANVPQYTVRLYKDSSMVVTNIFTLETPEAGANVAEKEGVFVLVDKDEMYLYLVGDASTGKDYLVFNANNAATKTSKAGTILPYDLSFSVNNGKVAFKTVNEFTKSIVAKNFDGGASFRVTQFKIDLSYFAIAENAPYLFQLLTDKTEDGLAYYTVDAARKITPAEFTAVGEKETAAPNSCTSLSSKGYKVTGEGDALLGYVALEIGSSHTWVLDPAGQGLYKCSVCGAILNSERVNSTGGGEGRGSIRDGFVISKENLQNVSQTGLTLSFWAIEVNKDWDSTALSTRYLAAQITMPNLQGNMMANLPDDAPEAIKEAYNVINKANILPGDVGASNWDEFSANGNNTYVTIVVKPGKTADDGVKYYKNGNLVMNYPGTNATVATYVDLFLLCAEVDGVIVNGAKFVSVFNSESIILEKKTLTAEQAIERYGLYLAEKDLYPKHTHSYDTTAETGTDLCACGKFNPKHGDAAAVTAGTAMAHKWDDKNQYCTFPQCGVLNPDHTHVDENKDYYCDLKGCGELLEHPHDFKTDNDHCKLCKILNPDHGKADAVEAGTAKDHAYVNGICTMCEKACEHKTVEQGTCTVCNGKLTPTTENNVKLGEWTEAAGFSHKDYTIKNGESLKVSAIFTDGGAGTWNGIVPMIMGANDFEYFLRPAGDYASTGWKWGTPLTGHTVTNPGFKDATDGTNQEAVALVNLKKTAKIEIDFTFVNGVITVKLSYFAKTDNTFATEATRVDTFTISGYTKSECKVGLTVDGATLEGGTATVTKTAWTWKATTPEA